MNVNAYHKSVELSLMRRHMRYKQKDFEDDWNSMLALCILNADDPQPYRVRLMAISMDRILAYLANNPDARPFNSVTFSSEIPTEGVK